MAEQKTIVGQTVAEVADVMDEKVTKVVTESANVAETLIARMTEVISQYGPDVAEASLSILRVDAFAHAARTIITLSILPTTIALCIYLAYKFRNTIWQPAPLIVGFFALLFLCISVVEANFPAVLGIFVPEYWALVKAGVL